MLINGLALNHRRWMKKWFSFLAFVRRTAKALKWTVQWQISWINIPLTSKPSTIYKNSSQRADRKISYAVIQPLLLLSWYGVRAERCLSQNSVRKDVNDAISFRLVSHFQLQPHEHKILIKSKSWKIFLMRLNYSEISPWPPLRASLIYVSISMKVNELYSGIRETAITSKHRNCSGSWVVIIKISDTRETDKKRLFLCCCVWGTAAHFVIVDVGGSCEYTTTKIWSMKWKIVFYVIASLRFSLCFWCL